MIRLGLRLATAGGREAVLRLVVIGVAVALGVGMLLSALAGIHALTAQNARYAWLNTGAAPSTVTGADPLWWQAREDYFQGRPVVRVDLAATSPRSPVPPGLARLPGPGEYYASPDLAALLRTTPADQLGGRFPGHPVGTIGRAALPAPDSLVVVVGHPPEEMAARDATRVSAIATADPANCARCVVGIDRDGMLLLLSVVSAAMIFPVLMFIGTATRLAAARREQRFAAMRLVGATPRQVSALAAAESAVAAVAGTVAGFGLYLLLRPAIARVPFTGARFFVEDLSLRAVDVLVVGVGVPVGAAVAAWLALRRVRISPLGVSRRVTPRPPRAWRVVPLLLGLGELALVVGHRPGSTDGQTAAYLSGFLVTMAGLVVAGPWLTMVGSRLLASRARRPAALIAARRLADSPQAGFRAVSGLVLALFVVAAATGIITTIIANRGAPRADSVAARTLTTSFWQNRVPEGQHRPAADDVPAALRSVPGVRHVYVVRANPAEPQVVLAPIGPGDPPPPEWWPGLISCAELSGTPEYGQCPPGARVVTVSTNLLLSGPMVAPLAGQVPVWPAVDLDPADVDRLPVISVVVDTDGSDAARERARTLLETALPLGSLPSTVAEDQSDFTRQLVQWQRLADVVMLASLPIAGCGLAVAVVGGLTERKRPFSMLRLAGVPLAVLRRVVLLESVVPLVVVAAVAIGTGFLAAHLFISAQMEYRLEPPGSGFYLMVAAGLALSLAIVASALPLLRRITGPETARNE